MTLTNAFATARSGITSAQTGIDLASRNIAGAGQEGYTRKVQQQNTVVLNDGQSTGLRQQVPVRVVDTDLQRDLRGQYSVVEEINSIDDFLGRMELMFGAPSSDMTIAAKVTDMRNAFERLSVTPNLASAQSEAVRVAEQLAEELNRLSGEVQELRFEANQRLDSSVNAVNEALDSISDLNAQIRELNSLSTATGDLEDQRDIQIQRIAEEMNIRTFQRESGQLAVMTGGSQFLLDHTVHELEFSPTPVVTPDQTLSSIGLDDGLPGAIVPIDDEITTGRIAGLLNVRDTLLPRLQDQLDALAFELAQKLSTVTVAGQTTDLNLFVDDSDAVPTVRDGFAAVIAVNSDIVADPSMLRDGRAGGTFTAGGVADPSLPLAVIDLFENNADFTGPPENYTVTFANDPSPGDTVAITIDGVTHNYNMAATTVGSLVTSVAEINGNFTGVTASAATSGGFALDLTFDDGGLHTVTVAIVDASGPPDELTATVGEVTATGTTGLSDEATFEGFVAEILGFQANQKADYENRLSFQEQLKNVLQDRFTDQSMVNIDEEVASLVELQAAFTASARVLTTVQRALDELLDVLR